MGSADASVSATVSREGKISLPARQRRAAGIEPGTRVSIRIEGNRIVVQSMDALLDELQVEARALMDGVEDSVDSFIADKYVEARREYDL